MATRKSRNTGRTEKAPRVRTRTRKRTSAPAAAVPVKTRTRARTGGTGGPADPLRMIWHSLPEPARAGIKRLVRLLLKLVRMVRQLLEWMAGEAPRRAVAVPVRG